MLDGHFGCINVAKHLIELFHDNMQPVHLAPYSATPKMREFEKHKSDKIIEKKVLEPAQTEWVAPVVFVPKKHKTMRFFVYCKRLNALTKRYPYFTPRMDECIN